MYQLNIAFGEVLGYAVAAMFFGVAGDWRYILGSSLVFSTILLVGMLFMPESPRYLMHKGRPVEAYGVWKRIRGFDSYESKEEFLGMRQAVAAENEEQANTKKWAWLDFFTNGRARRAMIYANIMVFLGQFTGVNAVMYYMGVLMTKIGFDDRTSVYMSLVGGGSLLIGTIPARYYSRSAVHGAVRSTLLGQRYASWFLHRSGARGSRLHHRLQDLSGHG